MNQNLVQPLLKVGVSPEDAKGLAGFLHVALSHSLHQSIVEELGEEEMKRINAQGEGRNLSAGEGVKLIEEAYRQKTGKTLAEAGREILAKQIQTVADLVAQAKYDARKLAYADPATLKALESVLATKNWQQVKSILDKVLQSRE